MTNDRLKWELAINKTKIIQSDAGGFLVKDSTLFKLYEITFHFFVFFFFCSSLSHLIRTMTNIRNDFQLIIVLDSVIFPSIFKPHKSLFVVSFFSSSIFVSFVFMWFSISILIPRVYFVPIKVEDDEKNSAARALSATKQFKNWNLMNTPVPFPCLGN